MKHNAIKKLVYGFWEKDLKDVRIRRRNLDFPRQDLVNDVVGVRRRKNIFSL